MCLDSITSEAISASGTEKKIILKKFQYHFLSNNSVIPNQMFFDKRLRGDDVKVLGCLNALPDGWVYHPEKFAEMVDLGRDALRKALRNLEEHGYITRHQIMHEDGTFSNIEINTYLRGDAKEQKANAGDSSIKKFIPSPEKSGAGKTRPLNKEYIEIQRNHQPPTSLKSEVVKDCDFGSVGGFSTQNQSKKQPAMKPSARENDSTSDNIKSFLIPACISSLPLTEDEKKNIHHAAMEYQRSEPDVSRAISHCTAPGFKINKTLTHAIIHFIKHPERITPTQTEKQKQKVAEQDSKAELKEKRYRFAERYRKNLMKILPPDEKLTRCPWVNHEYIEFSINNVKTKIYYSSETYTQEFVHQVKKNEFPDPIALEKMVADIPKSFCN